MEEADAEAAPWAEGLADPDGSAFADGATPGRARPAEGADDGEEAAGGFAGVETIAAATGVLARAVAAEPVIAAADDAASIVAAVSSGAVSSDASVVGSGPPRAGGARALGVAAAVEPDAVVDPLPDAVPAGPPGGARALGVAAAVESDAVVDPFPDAVPADPPGGVDPAAPVPLSGRGAVEDEGGGAGVWLTGGAAAAWPCPAIRTA